MTKISSQSALTGAGVDTAADLVPVVDMSETGIARNKKMTFAEFLLAHREGIQDLVAALLVAGTNVTLTYDDGVPSVTIDAAAPVPGDITGFNEAVDDRVAALVQAGSGITKTYNDGAGTLTLTATAPAGGLVYKGATDCSANPNYPAALQGESYLVSVAGKIGGASGITVDVGDFFIASADNAGGTQASVGTSWFVLEKNLIGAATAGAITGSGLTMATSRLLGRTTASTGAVEEISVGAGLSLTGGALTRAAPAIQAVTSSGTVTPTFADDQVNITAQAAALDLANPTGTAVPAWGIAIRIKDNGTARAITYGTQYRAIGVTLPTTTVISKTLYLGMIYNSTDTKWDVVAVAQEA